MKWKYDGITELGRRINMLLPYGASVRQVFNMIVDHHRVAKPTLGVKFSWRVALLGVHYSRFNKRVCINIIPFVTVYYVRKGGLLP